MIRMLATGALLLAFSSAASAAEPKWKFELYGDAEMSNCTVTYSAPGVIQIHIFQTGDTPATASQFALYAPDCLPGAVWMGDIIDPYFLTLDHTQHEYGLSVAFRGCRPMPIHIGYVNFFVTDLGVECCDFPVSDPSNPYVDATTADCNFEGPYKVELGRAIINPNPQCPCQAPVAAQATSWGRIKALYR